MEQPALTKRTAQIVASTMETRGKSQRALADAAGIPFVTLNRRLHGVSSFTLEELEQIAPALDTTVSAIIALAESPAEVLA